MSKSKIIVIATLFLFIVLFIPLIPITVVPAWQLQTVDENGNPLSNIEVSQGWQNYSLEFWESRRHIENAITDQNGLVNFPERKIRVSIVQIGLAKIRDIGMTFNPHASYGNQSTVLGSDKCSWERYEEGKEMPSRIVCKK